MSNLGAIPKFKGGARPKTKIVLVSNEQISNNFEGHSNSYQNEKTLNGSIKSDYNSREANKYKGKSYSNVSENNHQIRDLHDQVKTTGRPIEERNILISDHGVQIRRPALNAAWVEKRLFIHYIRPPLAATGVDGFAEGALDAWLEQMEFLNDDLKWLLNLPHHRFWSQVIHDRSVQECLEAYLAEGPRWYDDPPLPPQLDSCVASVINEIHQAVFLVYLRLSTFKETKDDFISPDTFATLIYDNFLYDICKCLDLCVLYGTTNGALLHKMISNIFQVQPKYYEDLALLVHTLKNSVFDSLEEKFGIYDPTLPRSVCPELAPLPLEELVDVVRYMQDTFASLHAFVAVFPEACDTFHQKDFGIRLSSFYGKAIPKLLELLSPVDEEERLLRRQLRRDLGMARVNALAIFRDILAWTCLRQEPSSESPTLESIGRGVESFTHLMTTCLEDKVFIFDYNSAFGIEREIAYFQEKGADMTPLNFVKEAVESTLKEVNLFPDAVAVDEDTPAGSHKHATTTDDDTSGMNGYYVGETVSQSGVELTSLVSSILDLLPDLGHGFVKECLKYYNYSTEETLNALLEGKLPPVLEALDRSLKDPSPPREEDRPPPVGAPQETASDDDEGGWEGPLYNRLNVYDDDEFDVFRNPQKLDRSRVRKGKDRSQDKPVWGLEKDPELAKKMKQILHGYESSGGLSIYEDEEKYSPQVAATGAYEDEYDDTYDDDDAGDIDGGFLDQGKRGRAAGGFISMRGRGALNTPGMNFGGEEEEEEGARPESGSRGETPPTTESFKERRPPPGAKFKRANASIRRGAPSSEADWDPRGRVPSRVFTSNFKGGNRGGRRGYEGETAEPADAARHHSDDVRVSAPASQRGPTFEPFCEDPQETRRRYERKRQEMQFRSRGTNPQPSNGGPAHDGQASSWEPGGSKVATKSSKHSGKSWRQGTQGEDNDRQDHGGKYKEDTNHGKAQDRSHRYKMIHKNEQRRNAAQAKYRNNF